MYRMCGRHESLEGIIHAVVGADEGAVVGPTRGAWDGANTGESVRGTNDAVGTALGKVGDEGDEVGITDSNTRGMCEGDAVGRPLGAKGVVVGTLLRALVSAGKGEGLGTTNNEPGGAVDGHTDMSSSNMRGVRM